ncbi:hypothetical protein B7486_60020, partial [cyanobacterium TDX16]
PGEVLLLNTGTRGASANRWIPGAGYIGLPGGDGGSSTQAHGGGAGGAGGSASEIYRGGPTADVEGRIVVAGGGGGGGGHHQSVVPAGQGGAGGGAQGGDGTCGTNPGIGGAPDDSGEGGPAVGGSMAGDSGGMQVGGDGGDGNAAGVDGGGGGGAGAHGGGGGGSAPGTVGGCGGGGGGIAPAGTLAQAGVAYDPSIAVYSCPDPCRPTFSDVSREHPFFWEVEVAAHTEVAGGYEDGGFHPSANVSRQAMAAFLFRLFGIDPDQYQEPETPSYQDVATSHPFYEEIEYLGDAGIASGYEDGTFRPSAPVTRQSMSAFLFRASDQEEAFVAPANSTFADVGPSHPFRVAVEWMASASITTGYDDGTFRPSAP